MGVDRAMVHDVGAGKENPIKSWNRQQYQTDSIIKTLSDDKVFLSARAISIGSPTRKPRIVAFKDSCDVHVGQYVQVLSDFAQVCEACAACGDYSSEVVELLIGKIVRVSLIDASDNSVQVEVANDPSFPFSPFQWIAVSALCAAASWLTLCHAERPKEALAVIRDGDFVDIVIASFAALKWLQESNPSRRQHWHAIGSRNESWDTCLLEGVAQLLASADFVVAAVHDHLHIARRAIRRGYVGADHWVDNVLKALSVEEDESYRKLFDKLGKLHPDWDNLKQTFFESRKRRKMLITSKTRIPRQRQCVLNADVVPSTSKSRSPALATLSGLAILGGTVCLIAYGHARLRRLRN